MVNVCFNISIQYQIFVTSSFPIPLSAYASCLHYDSNLLETLDNKNLAFCFVWPIVCVVLLIIFFLNAIKLEYYQINYIQ